MPTRPPAACSDPACPGTRGGCARHPVVPARWADGARGRAMTPGWDATRARILRRDPTCRLCQVAPSVEVHHAEPGVEVDAALMGVCHPCHDRVTQAQARAARWGTAVPPPRPAPDRRELATRADLAQSGPGASERSSALLSLP